MNTPKISIEEFVSLVFEMREQQKKYFRFRSKPYLEKSIELEMKVDEVLKQTVPSVPEAQMTIQF